MENRLVLVAVLAAATLSGTGCRCPKQASPIENLNKELAANVAMIDFSALAANFDWDRMYVFEPYEGKRFICEKLHLPETDVIMLG